MVETVGPQEPFEPVPHALFTVDGVAPRDRFAVWKESIACVFDVEAEREVRGEGFEATIDAHMFGQAMLARTTTLNQTWERSARTIARDGMDHYMIQFFVSGSQGVEHRHGSIEMGEHSLVVYDLAQEALCRTDRFTNLSLIVGRESLGALLDDPDRQHIRTLDAREPMAALLRDHLMSLHRLSGRMTAAQALEVGPLTVALAAACLNGSAAATPGGDGAVSFARLTVVKRAIEHSLDDPDLSVERIARMVGMSRTMLYQAFEPMGGVAAYVRERRLRRAMALLVDPRQRHRTIYGIAMACGFLNESAFGRAFRRRFGVSPRDARHGGGGAPASPRADRDLDRRYELWLSQLAA